MLLCSIEVFQRRAVLFPDNDWLWSTGRFTFDGIRHARVDVDCTIKLLRELGF